MPAFGPPGSRPFASTRPRLPRRKGANRLELGPARRVVSFPLAEWIDAHSGCRHNLGLSGMRGTVRHPTPRPGEISTADPERLRRQLADDLDVDPRRVFLTPGATEANSRVLAYLAGRARGRKRTARVRYPEYPPLVDGARWSGFRPQPSARSPATVAVVSNPRNPEGDRWPRSRLLDWSDGAESLVVDETFREFAHAPSVHDLPRRGVWTTGSFTKFYAGDDLRVGFVVAPDSERARFAEYHGVVADPLSDFSIAGALATWTARDRIRREVDSVLERNRDAFRRGFPGATAPEGPVAFDRGARDGERSARRLLRASVLVCPGGLFGDPTGVRLCLTRRTFPSDLTAYLAARGPGRSG